jgi:alpha-N-acetylglucosamine transferase
LFCGEDFNKELTRERVIGINEKVKEIKNDNIIDFGLAENNEINSLQKKIEKICQQEEDEFLRLILYNPPSIWLKNIDKITDSKIEKKLLEVIDFKKNSNLGEYYQEIEIGENKYKIKRNVDLSQFVLVVTTSSTNPKINNQLLTKLKHIDTF